MSSVPVAPFLPSSPPYSKSSPPRLDNDDMLDSSSTLAAPLVSSTPARASPNASPRKPSAAGAAAASQPYLPDERRLHVFLGTSLISRASSLELPSRPPSSTLSPPSSSLIACKALVLARWAARPSAAHAGTSVPAAVPLSPPPPQLPLYVSNAWLPRLDKDDRLQPPTSLMLPPSEPPASQLVFTALMTDRLTTFGLATAGLKTAGLGTAELATARLATAGLATAGLTAAGLTAAGLTAAGLTTARS
eukprot:320552-Chlamydomonas_euryale.AAC.2